MKNCHIFGGNSGFGSSLASEFSKTHNVFVHGKPNYDLLNEQSIHELGKYLKLNSPDVFILNSFVRSKDFSNFYLQAKCFNILWEYLKDVNCSFVIISSAATWFSHEVDNGSMEYRKSKQLLNKNALVKGFLNTNDKQRKARVILFEPATMENRKSTANERNTTLLSFNDAYKMIDFSIKMNLPFLKIGAQGSNAY